MRPNYTTGGECPLSHRRPKITGISYLFTFKIILFKKCKDVWISTLDIILNGIKQWEEFELFTASMFCTQDKLFNDKHPWSQQKKLLKFKRKKVSGTSAKSFIQLLINVKTLESLMKYSVKKFSSSN